jgi:hypothetical protein
MSKERKNCMCTAMLYEPKENLKPEEIADDFKQHSNLYDRFTRLKQFKLLQQIFSKKDKVETEPQRKSLLSYFFNLSNF